MKEKVSSCLDQKRIKHVTGRFGQSVAEKLREKYSLFKTHIADEEATREGQ